MAKQNAVVNIQQQNLTLRSLLLQTALRQRKNLGVTLGALGQTSRIKLFNVGILTSLAILVTCPITIGTAIAVASARAPWNLINRIKITDFDGTDRLNLSGYQLYLLNSVRRRQPFGWNNQQAAVAGAGIVANPSLPTAIGNGTISFYLHVPICVNDNALDGIAGQDLTGAIYAQTGVGELYLSIDWNTNLYVNGSQDAVYAGAPTTTVVLNGVTGPSVQVWQNYLLPQPVGERGALPIPPLDIMSVYELNGNLRSSDNLAVNVEKLISLPNVRRVIGTYVNYFNGTAYAANDISQFRLLVNGNNILQEWSLTAQQVEQRLTTEGDLGNGVYFWTYRDHPIETSIYGNVQLGVTPTTVNANAFCELAFESIYTKGQALPGMAQAQ